MIKFFRQIRYQLMEQNKTGRYLKYAFGEIILVVIGILLALQINNYNELKKARAFEVKMLNEIRNELIQDTIYFSMIAKRADRAMKGSKGLMGYYGTDNPDLDSLRKYAMMMNYGFQFNYHKGAYEAIKSTGIDRISNDSIRQLLTDMYDFRLPRADNFIVKYTDERKEARLNNLFIMCEVSVIQVLDKAPIMDVRVKASAMKDPAVLKLIMQAGGENNEAISRLDNLRKASERLLKLLDKELEIDDVLANIPQNNWETSD